MRVLVTGGAGYIGSHAIVELISAGYEPVVVDNLSNSSLDSLQNVHDITGVKVPIYKIDIREKEALRKVFIEQNIDAVIHFAGLKAVAESVEKPLSYYENNVVGTLVLLDVMKEFCCKKIIFSSSATVYGEPEFCPIKESATLSAVNPYGRTKLMIEDILRDVNKSDPSWSIVILRYFNPVGAHESGLIGENPQGVPNNLMPLICQVAAGERDKLSIFGGDYPSRDGTGVRDYIHVVDLAKGHIKALEKVKETGVLTFNLGTGIGYSVLEMVRAFESASGKKVAYEIVNRRAGDVAECVSDVSMASEILGWQAVLGLDRMCQDTWRWQLKNSYKS